MSINYENNTQKQWFLMQFAKLDRFPGSTKILQKIFSAIFGPFSPLSHFFDLSKWKFDLKTSIFIKRKILEACFSLPNSTFSPQLPPPTFSNFVVFQTYVTQFKWGQDYMFWSIWCYIDFIWLSSDFIWFSYDVVWLRIELIRYSS